MSDTVNKEDISLNPEYLKGVLNCLSAFYGFCEDCKKASIGYMVNRKTWKHGVPKNEDHKKICPQCLEKRLGRKLRRTDFIKCPLNFIIQFGMDLK